MSARWRSTLWANGLAAFSRALRRAAAIRSAVGLGLRELGRRARDALVGALALGQLERRCLGARAQVGGGVRAEAAAQLRELLQPLLDAVEDGGIGIEAGQVRAQLGRPSRAAPRRCAPARRPGRRAPGRGRARDRARARPPRLRDRAGALVGVEQLGGLARRLQQHVEVTQPAALAHELVLLARLRVDARHRLGERAQLGEPWPARPRRRPRRRRARAGRRASARQAAPIVAAQRSELLAARGIEQVELHRRAHEPARLVLGDHLDQRLADALEVVARAAAPVEQCARAALAADAACDDDALGVLRRQVGQLLGQLDVRERGLDVGLARGRADQRSIGAAAQQQADGLREDRLAGARLAGQHVEARVQASAARSARARGSRRRAPRASAREGVAIALQERDLGQQAERGALGRQRDGDATRRARARGRSGRRRGSRAPAARARGWRPRPGRRAAVRAGAP